MDLREILNKSFGILSFCSYGILFTRCFYLKKVLSELKKPEKEIDQSEVKKNIMRGGIFLIVGSILGIIFVSMFFYTFK